MMFGGGMILIWVALLIGIVYLVKYLMDHNRQEIGGHPSKSVLQILKKRCAKGEINREEFEAMKSDLGE